MWCCCELYNAGLEERKAAWETCRVLVALAMQSARLPGIKEVRPEYRDRNAQILQDVLHPLDTTFQAVFRRVQAGEQPRCPRFHGQNRYHSFTDKEDGNGARLENGYLGLAKIGRIAVRWSRPIQGTSKTVTGSREPDGRSVCCSCAEVPIRPLPLTGPRDGQ